jgi:hypothetical protein
VDEVGVEEWWSGGLLRVVRLRLAPGAFEDLVKPGVDVAGRLDLAFCVKDLAAHGTQGRRAKIPGPTIVARAMVFC